MLIYLIVQKKNKGFLQLMKVRNIHEVLKTYGTNDLKEILDDP